MPASMVGRILRSADFQRVLAAGARARSAHFALHHLAAGPSLPAAVLAKRQAAQLSTADAPSCPPPVDDCAGKAPETALTAPGWWLGMVVPKRHARRAATRNLIKRQVRALLLHQRPAAAISDASDQAMGHGSAGPASQAAGATALPPGLWVLRLKAPFDVRQFPSAASDALRLAVRTELTVLIGRALQPAAATAGRR